MILEEDKQILDDLVSRYKLSDILVYIYWKIVDTKNNYAKNNPYSNRRKDALIDLANKIDESMEFARKIGE